MTKHIKVDDEVVVLSGEYKGVKGKVLRKIKDKVVVQGVNVRKKHVKPSESHPQGGLIELERPIRGCKVAIVAEGERVKLKKKIDENGKKTLYYVKEGKEVVHRTL